jgi:hypothetical protein
MPKNMASATGDTILGTHRLLSIVILFIIFIPVVELHVSNL